MNKNLLLLLFILFCTNSIPTQGQEQEIPENFKKELLGKIIPPIRSFVEKWGTYMPGTTITEINKLEENTVEIRGKVTYRGELCGVVKTDYKITMVTEGDNPNFDICVYCPYCFLGNTLKYEWDCKGVKYMEAKDYIQIINKIAAEQKK